MKSLLSGLGLVVAGATHAAEPNKNVDDARYQLSVKTSDACQLVSHQCDGRQNEVRFESPSGYYLSISKFSDRGSHVPFDKTYEWKRVGNVRGRITWEEQGSGTVGEFGKKFNLTEQSAVGIGAYIGHVSGSIRLNAIAEGTAYPLSVIIPAFSYQVGGHHIGFNRKTISYAGGHKVFARYDDAADGQTYYGGLKQFLGTSFNPSKNTHVLLNQFAQAGLDRISYGVGLGLGYTSSEDRNFGRESAGICQGRHPTSSAKFAFLVAACAEDTKRDALYELYERKAYRFADKQMDKVAQAQAVINKIENKTGYGYTLPSFTGADVLRGLGVESPYRVNTSVIIAATMKLGQSGHATISHAQPLDKSRNGNAVTSISLAYDF